MPIDSEFFLDNYAKAFNSFDPKIIASFYFPATIIMNDKRKKVMTCEGELERTLSQMLAKFTQVVIKRFVLKLQQTMRLSDTLFFSKMRWEFYTEQQQLCFGCATSYTLQKMPDNQLKMIVAVIDDDLNKLADIFSHAE
jgi:hypothetical protein